MGCLAERLASHGAAGTRAHSCQEPQGAWGKWWTGSRRPRTLQGRSLQPTRALHSGTPKGGSSSDPSSFRRDAGALSSHNVPLPSPKDKVTTWKHRGDVLKSFALQAVDYSFYRTLEPVSITPEYLWSDRLAPLLGYLTDDARGQVREAVHVAFKSHAGQKRKSGEPFITHPVEVTRILAELKMDHESLIAGLLHDTVEDTDAVSFEDIGVWFGPAVRRIVEGETKFSKIGKIGNAATKGAAGSGGGASGGAADVKALDLQQLFLSMTEEVRIIVVKLADRLHNMRTLDSMPEHKQRRIAEETLQVFAPLARLLGLYSIKEELEDLSFRFSDPRKYNRCREGFNWLRQEQRSVLLEAQQVLEEALSRDAYLLGCVDGFAVEVHYKALYSVYRRSRDKKCDFKDVSDIAQLRVVLKESRPPQSAWPQLPQSLTDGGGSAQASAALPAPSPRGLYCGTSAQLCYHVMGVVHSMWAPVPGSMKDYIATPKTNGYQSLHTVVLPLGSQKLFPLEVQIRTEEMQRLAEYGIAGENWVAAGRVMDFISSAREQQLTGVTMDGVGIDEGVGSQQQGEGSGEEGGFSSAPRPLRQPNGTSAPPAEKANGFAHNGSAAAVNGAKINGTKVNGTAQPGVLPVGDGGGDSRGVNSAELFKSAVRYNTPKLDQQVMMRRVNWLNSIREWQEEFLDSLTAREFVDCVTDDLLGQGVFVFTPSGHVMRLPKGATVVDFAYHVHTDVGNQMIAAKVNSQVVHPGHVLRNAEVVEVITYAGPVTPNAVARHQQWLPFARTRSARYKLSRFMAKHAAQLEQLPEAGVQQPGVVGPEGQTWAGGLNGDLGGGLNGALVAADGTPLLPSSSQLGSGSGPGGGSVGGGGTVAAGASVRVTCNDRSGLLADISQIIAEYGHNIKAYSGCKDASGQFVMEFQLEGDPARLEAMCSAVGGVNAVVGWRLDDGRADTSAVGF